MALTVDSVSKAEAGQDWSMFQAALCTGPRSDEEVEALEDVSLYEEHYNDESALLPADDSQESTKSSKFRKRLSGLRDILRRIRNFFSVRFRIRNLRIRNQSTYII